MKIKTEILQNAVAKAIKGASMNKMIPITSLIGIEVSNSTLILSTTDGSNQLRVKSDIEVDPLYNPTFYTIVDADTFAKLVGKTTSEYITLETEDNYLKITGNGTYKLDIPVNQDGEIIKFPTYDTLEGVTGKQISVEQIKNLLNTAKQSLAKTMEIPCITGYYIGDNIITTDRQLICVINENLLDDSLLITAEMAELIQLFTNGNNVTIKKQDNKILIENAELIIAGKELEGKDIYPVQSIENCANLEYKASIQIKKQELLDVLDRMSLFVSEYDKNGVFLSVTKNGLVVTSQKSNATEVIEIANPVEVEFKCLIDIEMLKSEIQSSIASDIVTLYYGQEFSIKLVEGNVNIVISLLEKAV